MKNGFFITVEGLDGSGKTTVVNKINTYLLETIQKKEINYNDVIVTREPGNKKIPACYQIREIILNHKDTDINTNILLFAANRNEHLKKLIIPELNKNNIVVSDRFVDSSYAYQGTNHKLFKFVYKTNDFIIKPYYPDLTFYLDVDYETATQRINNENRTVQNNHFDYLSKKEFNQIRKNFLHLAKKFKKRIIIINANASQDDVYTQIKYHLNVCLKHQ